MKKKRTLLGLALLVAVLILGVGYAALTSIDLDLTGTVNVSPSDANFKVVWSEGTPANTEDSVSVVGSKSVTFTVNSLKAVGSTATATFKIKNNSGAGINAIVSVPTIEEGDENADYFTVTTNYGDSAITLAPTEDKEVTVTVTLDKAPVDEDITGTFTITLKADAEAAA